MKAKEIKNAGFVLMDEAQEMFECGQVADGMTFLSLGLQHLREAHTAKDWNHFAQSQFLQHPIKDLIHQDPFTRHSFEKPRQYAGDAPDCRRQVRAGRPLTSEACVC